MCSLLMHLDFIGRIKNLEFAEWSVLLHLFISLIVWFSVVFIYEEQVFATI